jgi:MoaA/NifB/PqqE/SkfB family radical SAM enzyme
MEKYSPYNELKIFRHLNRIGGLLQGERVAPIYVRIKPTNVCNQRCYYCAYSDDNLYDGRKVEKRESIPWNIMECMIHDLVKMKVKAVTLSGGGEPLCYHSIKQTLELIRDAGIDYSIITNGQALKGEAAELLQYAKWVRVSFDSYHAKTYEEVRCVDTHAQVVQNIENFAKRKQGCTLGINCVVTKQNADQIYDLCRLVKELGVDNIKLSPLLVKADEAEYHETIKESVSEQIFRAKEELETEGFTVVDKYTNDLALDENFRKSYHKCVIQEVFAVIAADSKVYRCHQRAYTKAGEIGDLSKQSFQEIWYSPEVIDNVRSFDPCRECRFRCAFDERNILLNDFFDMDTEHINFI